MGAVTRIRWPMRAVAGVCLVGASAGLGTTAAHARGHAVASPVIMHGYKCTVVATKHHRKVTGRAGAVVCGVSGNDVLRAVGPGRVVLIAGPGRDKLVASSAPGHQDTLIGGSGPDTMVAGSGGDDVIETGTGSDTIDCGGSGGGTGGSGGGGIDESARNGSGQVTVVGADSGDSVNSDCQGGTTNSASLEFQGTVNTTDGSTTMNITYGDVNDAARAWLDANGDPTSIDISLVGASIEVDNGGSLVKGDDVEVAANANGTALVAVDVQAQLPASSGFDD